MLAKPRVLNLIGLRILLQIDPDKRHEFIQSARLLLPQRTDNGNRCRCLLLQAVDDENRFCMIVEYERNEKLLAYLHSDRYRALLGAATVLGMSNDLDIVEYQPVSLE